MFVQLGIDQVRFILRLPEVTAHTLLHKSTLDAVTYKAVWGHILSCTGDWKKGAKYWKTAKGAMTKSELPLDGGSKLVVGLGWSSKAQRHFMTVQFNPSRMTSDGAGEFKMAFQCMFDGWYDEFFDRAKVSYIETPLDVIGAKMTDYLYFDTRLRSLDDHYENVGTLGLGSRTSSRYTPVYDKAKEIADKGGPVINANWLRIEPRRTLDIPAWEIAHMPCTFDTLQVIERKKLAGIKHSLAINLFRKRVFDHMLQPQDAYRMAADRKALLVGLLVARPDWYKPQVLWQDFPTAVNRITPAGLDELAVSPS